MAVLFWDKAGERFYETGVDHGVLYPKTIEDVYAKGVVWNGLVSVTESPTGAEPNAQYADNVKYLNLLSAEEFNGTIEAFTYPDEFGVCDGSVELEPGISVSQQYRRTFGFVYRTLIGNDTKANNFGYKIHILYNCLAAPSEKAYATVNESPEPITFSWELSTSQINVIAHNPTAMLVVDSRYATAAGMKALEDALFGTPTTDSRLPDPEQVTALLQTGSGMVTPATPTIPANTRNLTIPTTSGVSYWIEGLKRTGTFPMTGDTHVEARPNAGSAIPLGATREWIFTYPAGTPSVATQPTPLNQNLTSGQTPVAVDVKFNGVPNPSIVWEYYQKSATTGANTPNRAVGWYPIVASTKNCINDIIGFTTSGSVTSTKLTIATLVGSYGDFQFRAKATNADGSVTTNSAKIAWTN